MNLTASQIRQDLSCFGEFGQQGYGYNVESLRNEVADILGMTREHTAIILGVGNLGRALIENFRFDRCGFRLAAAFDVDPSLVGREISGIKILPVEELEQYLKTNSISVGVLTVPQAVAQDMAEVLAQSSVRGIWNFTNLELHIEDRDTVVENIHFADSLLTLSYLISEAP